jgi:hypothetical protein
VRHLALDIPVKSAKPLEEDQGEDLRRADRHHDGVFATEHLAVPVVRHPGRVVRVEKRLEGEIDLDARDPGGHRDGRSQRRADDEPAAAEDPTHPPLEALFGPIPEAHAPMPAKSYRRWERKRVSGWAPAQTVTTSAGGGAEGLSRGDAGGAHGGDDAGERRKDSEQSASCEHGGPPMSPALTRKSMRALQGRRYHVRPAHSRGSAVYRLRVKAGRQRLLPHEPPRRGCDDPARRAHHASSSGRK